MKVFKEINLRDFEFWGGAETNAQLLSPEELDIVEMSFEDMYPDGLSETQLNDIFWFDFEIILDMLGITEEELEEREELE